MCEKIFSSEDIRSTKHLEEKDLLVDDEVTEVADLIDCINAAQIHFYLVEGNYEYVFKVKFSANNYRLASGKIYLESRYNVR